MRHSIACYPDEAVQATKARIEALKKESAVPDSPSKDSIPAKPPQARTKPAPLPDTKGPKKLSDVKVSANIAASLGNLKLASPASSPAAPGGGSARGGAAAPSPMAGSTPAALSHMDLLGSLDAPAPASTQKTAAPGGLLKATVHCRKECKGWRQSLGILSIHVYVGVALSVPAKLLVYMGGLF